MKIGKVSISGAALLALAAVCFFDTGGMALAVLLAAAAHEAGHYLALRALGMRLTEFHIGLLGLNMRVDGSMPYRADIAVSLAGPALSVLFAFAAAFGERYLGIRGAYLLAGVSLVFAAFNLLPVCPLDGGRAVYAAAAALGGPAAADKTAAVTGCAAIFSLLVAGTAVLIRTRVNFTLLAAAVWLLIGYCQKSGVGIQSRRYMKLNRKC